MSESSNKTQIVVAIIGLVALVLSALISNWDGIFSPKKPPVQEKAHRGLPEGQPWVVIGKNEIEPVKTNQYEGAFGYRYNGDGVKLASPDNMDFPNRSRLILLENGNALGPKHSGHADIQKLGEGRYSHWSDGTYIYLYFSTSDNSDPRENKRDYVVTVLSE